MVFAVCLSIFLWIRDMARLLRGTFVSWWYLSRIWPSVTDMQHNYHARYPTDDWYLAYMFSLVNFFRRCVSGRRVSPRVRVCPPPPPPIHEKTKIEQGWPGSTWAMWGGIWTEAWVCLHYWVVIWIAGFFVISPYIAQFMGCVTGRIHYGLKVVFWFRHFTAYHYHHDSRVLTGIENM